jgi:hypothetical protein
LFLLVQFNAKSKQNTRIAFLALNIPSEIELMMLKIQKITCKRLLCFTLTQIERFEKANHSMDWEIVSYSLLNYSLVLWIATISISVRRGE